MTIDRVREVLGRPPLAGDGRGVDEAFGLLDGEGGAIEVKRPEKAWPLRDDREATPSPDTYHGMPALKAPVWKAWIPTYFFVGGATGATATLAAATQLFAGRRAQGLVTKARWVAAAGCAVSAALLVADLGRPARFLNMMRVFRPTSPMNVGTWVLTGAGGSSAAAALFGRSIAGDAAGIASGLFGLPLAGYTAVLLAGTAVPVWNGTRRSLPWNFIGSAMASSGAVLDLLPLRRREAGIVRAFGAIGKATEIASSFAVEREAASEHPVVAAPLRRGRSGALWKAARLAAAASLAVSLLPGRSRGKRTLAGALGVAGALAMRFAIVSAGRASALEPRATFVPQRDERDASRATTDGHAAAPALRVETAPSV